MAREGTIITLGSLMAFAMALEERAGSLYDQMVDEKPTSDGLRMLRDRHKMRRVQLERMLREDLNEVTLEPMVGLHPGDYESSFMEPVAAEEALVRFYADAAIRGKAQLGHLSRSLTRLSTESEEMRERARKALSKGS